MNLNTSRNDLGKLMSVVHLHIHTLMYTSHITYLGVRQGTSGKTTMASPVACITSAFAITFLWNSCKKKKTSKRYSGGSN